MASLNVSSTEKDPRRLADVVRQLVEGKSNAIGTVTLPITVTTATVPAPTCSPGSFVMLSPQTANAAAALGTTWTVAGTGSFVIHFTSSAQVDRTFGFEVRG